MTSTSSCSNRVHWFVIALAILAVSIPARANAACDPDANSRHSRRNVVPNGVMFDRLLVDLPKCGRIHILPIALIEEGDGQENRCLASFSFRFLTGPSDLCPELCPNRCAQNELRADDTKHACGCI
jgi:hypothetical protein